MDVITKTKLRNIFKNTRSSMLLAGATGAVVLLAGATVLQLRASGFFAAADASQATVSGNAKLVSDATAYGGKTIQFTAPTETPPPPPPSSGSSDCALPKYPTPSCTGVPSGISLTTINGDVEIRKGDSLKDCKAIDSMVVSGCRITGSMVVLSNDVVIRNSEIYGEVKNPNGNNFTLENSTVGPPSGCNSEAAIGEENYIARGVEIRNFGDGFRVSGSEGNVLIEDSYILSCSNPGDHADGIQGYFGGPNVTIRHNTIDQRKAKDFTAPVFFADHSKAATIKNNLLMGGVGALYITYQTEQETVDTGPWVITGNRIVENTGFYWDINTEGISCATTTWSDNRLVAIDSNYNITSTGALINCGDNR